MNKQLFNKQTPIRFKQFTNKPFALFNCLGKVVLVGVLSVATLSHAKADGISTTAATQEDSLINREVRLEEVSVTGARAPITDAQSAVMVKVLSREDIIKAGVSTLNDVLKLASDVDVRQRGGFGLQTDISINGGTFDQIALLLNGINITNTQTGHNSFALPLSPNDIERIEIVDGASARVYGSTAFGGAINIVTKHGDDSRHRHDSNGGLSGMLDVAGGSYGTLDLNGNLTVDARRFLNLFFSGGYTRSDGGTHNSYFEKSRFFSRTNYLSEHLDISFQLGGCGNRFGANTFYSAKYDNQYEKTDNLTIALSTVIKHLPHNLRIENNTYSNLFRDHYQLIRHTAGTRNGENWHELSIVGTSLNASLSWLPGTSAIGAELKRERIYSTAYGQMLSEGHWKRFKDTNIMFNHKSIRMNTSVFAEHNLLLDKITISAGLLYHRVAYPYMKRLAIVTPDNCDVRSNTQWAPGIDISYCPSKTWKYYLSWNKSMRVPTFTDLFVSNVVQQGDTRLKPERNSMVKTGVRYRSASVNLHWSAFYSHGTDMIDWVYPTAESSVYEAMNIGRLDNMGYSIDMQVRIPYTTLESAEQHSYYRSVLSAIIPYQIKLSYSYIHQHHETDMPIYRSLYALEYLKHKFVAVVDQRLAKHLTANWTARWQQRMNGAHPYWKIDGKIVWTNSPIPNSRCSSSGPRVSTIYIQADNITNHRYIDIASVPQPGLWVMAGFTIGL